MLILKDDHKQHLLLLLSQPAPVIKDLCKLALDYLVKGPNPKTYQTAANKLESSAETIRNAVEGLAYLLVESCKLDVSGLDFRDSLLTLGLSEEQQAAVGCFYEAKKQEVRQALTHLNVNFPHYKNLEWRLDVQVASRSLLHQVTPLVTLEVALDDGQVVRLQTDPTNLLHMTRVLEEALHEAKSQHTRRIQRSFN